MGLVHFVRNPFDVVVSAFWFHLQEPAPETWIDKEVGEWVACTWAAPGAAAAAGTWFSLTAAHPCSYHTRLLLPP